MTAQRETAVHEVPEVAVARTLDQVEGLRTRWQALPWPREDGDIDFFLRLAGSRPEIVRPHAVLVGNRQLAGAGVAARIEDVSLVTQLGYKTIFAPRVRSLTIAPGGAACVSEDRGSVTTLVEVLLSALAAREADVVWFQSLPVDSVFADVLSDASSPVRRQGLVPARTHHRLALPESSAEFLPSRPSAVRKKLRQYGNKVEKTFGTALSISVLRQPSDLDRMFRDVDDIAKRTYQRGLGVGFVDSAESRSLLKWEMDNGLLRVYVMYLSEQPVAFWTGAAYRGVFFIGTTGYDPTYSKFNIGSYLLTRLIEDLCDDASVRFVDFGAGDALWKQQLASESWLEKDYLVFAPTLKGLGTNWLRAPVLAANQVAGSAAQTRAGRNVKKRWRQRLTPES